MMQSAFFFINHGRLMQHTSLTNLRCFLLKFNALTNLYCRYDEVCQYNFDKPNVLPSTGHFTEIVWSGSRKLGVGYALGRNARFPGYQCVYVVGRYKPTGNIIGGQRLQMNVKRGSFNEVYCQKRSRDLQGDFWDKRDHLKHIESKTARHHSKHHMYQP